MSIPYSAACSQVMSAERVVDALHVFVAEKIVVLLTIHARWEFGKQREAPVRIHKVRAVTFIELKAGDPLGNKVFVVIV